MAADSRPPILLDSLAVLRRRWLIVCLVALIAVGLAVGLSQMQTPIYRATAEVLVETGTPRAQFDPVTGGLRDPLRTIQTEIEFLESTVVRDGVAEELGRSADADAAEAEGADIIVVSATHEEPEEAARIANTYAEVYVRERAASTQSTITSTADEIQNRLDEVRFIISISQARLDEIDQAILTAGTNDTTDIRQERTRIQSGLTSLNEEEAELAEDLRDTEISGDVLAAGQTRVISPATEPDSPASPNVVANAAVALFLGLVLGVGLAFARDYLDDSIKRREDLEAAIDLPILASVPRVTARRGRRRPLLSTVEEPTSAAAEAYRSLRTSIGLISIDSPIRALSVTSAEVGEGKTTTCVNLAVATAQAHQRTLLVDGDLRRPRLEEFFDVDPSVGLTSLLLNEGGDAGPQPVPDVENLWVLPAGIIPPDPADLLDSARMASLVRKLKEHFDLIIIDSPPVLPVTDPVVISQLVDATIMVTSLGQTSRRRLRRALEMLDRTATPTIGLVLNNAKLESDGYGYGYHGYAKRTPERPPAPAPATDPSEHEVTQPSS